MVVVLHQPAVTAANVLRQPRAKEAARQAVKPMGADAFVIKGLLRQIVAAAVCEHQVETPDTCVVLRNVPGAVEEKGQAFARTRQILVVDHEVGPCAISRPPPATADLVFRARANQLGLQPGRQARQSLPGISG